HLLFSHSFPTRRSSDLGFSIVLWAVAAGFLALAWWLQRPTFTAGAFVALVLWAFVASFFRDPRRAAPADPDALVSPADGTVTHVDRKSTRLNSSHVAIS